MSFDEDEDLCDDFGAAYFPCSDCGEYDNPEKFVMNENGYYICSSCHTRTGSY